MFFIDEINCPECDQLTLVKNEVGECYYCESCDSIFEPEYIELEHLLHEAV